MRLVLARLLDSQGACPADREVVTRELIVPRAAGCGMVYLRIKEGKGRLAQRLADEPRRAGGQDVHFSTKARNGGLATLRKVGGPCTSCRPPAEPSLRRKYLGRFAGRFGEKARGHAGRRKRASRGVVMKLYSRMISERAAVDLAQATGKLWLHTALRRRSMYLHFDNLEPL